MPDTALSKNVSNMSSPSQIPPLIQVSWLNYFKGLLTYPQTYIFSLQYIFLTHLERSFKNAKLSIMPKILWWSRIKFQTRIPVVAKDKVPTFLAQHKDPPSLAPIHLDVLFPFLPFLAWHFTLHQHQMHSCSSILHSTGPFPCHCSGFLNPSIVLPLPFTSFPYPKSLPWPFSLQARSGVPSGYSHSWLFL